MCDGMLDCDDAYCSVHKDEIVDLYTYVVNAYITASDHIPTTSASTLTLIPSWNDGAKMLLIDFTLFYLFYTPCFIAWFLPRFNDYEDNDTKLLL